MIVIIDKNATQFQSCIYYMHQNNIFQYKTQWIFQTLVVYIFYYHQSLDLQKLERNVFYHVWHNEQECNKKQMQETVQTLLLLVGLGNDALGGLFSTKNKIKTWWDRRQTRCCRKLHIHSSQLTKNATNSTNSIACSRSQQWCSWWTLLQQNQKKPGEIAIEPVVLANFASTPAK